MEIVAFDTDDKADGSGKAKITWISKDCMSKKLVKLTDVDNGYLDNTIRPLIPTSIINNVVSVTKQNGTSGSTSNELWIPNCYEIGLTIQSDTQSGAKYSTKFKTNSSRIKKYKGTKEEWWTRSTVNYYRYYINSSGSGADNTNSGGALRGFVFGFCT